MTARNRDIAEQWRVKRRAGRWYIESSDDRQIEASVWRTLNDDGRGYATQADAETMLRGWSDFINREGHT